MDPLRGNGLVQAQPSGKAVFGGWNCGWRGFGVWATAEMVVVKWGGAGLARGAMSVCSVRADQDGFRVLVQGSAPVLHRLVRAPPRQPLYVPAWCRWDGKRGPPTGHHGPALQVTREPSGQYGH